MAAPESIVNLVERFHRHVEVLKRAEYGETQVRVEYINPFFEAMGWDVHNRQGYAEAYKDVVHEDAVRIGGVLKAPDYGFRMGGQRKFFVEAKKPSVDLRSDVSPAYQLRRYAWSAKLPLSILTDFEEMAVYDCRSKPDKGDTAATGRVIYLHYTDYAEKWDELAGIFAPESIRKGSFDAYAESNKLKRGTAEVDDAFLADIEQWREMLARSLALRNPALNTRELNFAVQQTLDRIIFLRICEARGLEQYGLLQKLTNGGSIYARLMEEFRRADFKYNSGLFHFSGEKGQAGDPDELTPTLHIDDKVLKEILGKLYYPESPYEFAVIPADILGQIYEQFLGKVIRLTAGHQAKVEEKPEVKKAGGVYYTPTYIVDYIVRQTVGKLVEGKKPGPKGGVSKLRIVDPACGSGSFLLGAYQFLLDWHLHAYMAENPAQWAQKSNPQLYLSEKGGWRLTLDERKRILLNNIFGVDIDAQAVEVTKLSLLLKVLEGESGETLAPQLQLMPDRLLPDLARNIRCGNSLIGPDYYESHQMTLLDDEMMRVNVFDWHAAFAEVFAEGGFDAVIGNPPYIRIQAMKEWAPLEVEFYKKRYKAASKGNYDIYVVFVEKGLSLLRESGLLGFILPHKFFNAQYGEPIRKIIADGAHLSSIVHFGDQQVFSGATTYTCILLLDIHGASSFEITRVGEISTWIRGISQPKGSIPSSTATSSEWSFPIGAEAPIIDKLEEQATRLRHICTRIFQGIIPGADKVYSVRELSRVGTHSICFSQALQCEVPIETAILRKIVSGAQVKRYVFEHSDERVIFPYVSVRGVTGAQLIAPAQLKAEYPCAFDYFAATRRILDERDRGSAKGADWYRYIRTQNIGLQDEPKLAVPRLVGRLHAALDINGHYCLDNVDVGGIMVDESQNIDPRYLLALLNSSLANFYFIRNTVPFRGGYFSANRQYIENIPIPTPVSTKQQAEIADWSTSMLSLHTKLQSATLPQLKEAYRAQIAATDRKIDELVYELYGLTDKEVAIVEGQAVAEEESPGAEA